MRHYPCKDKTNNNLASTTSEFVQRLIEALVSILVLTRGTKVGENYLDFCSYRNKQEMQIGWLLILDAA